MLDQVHAGWAAATVQLYAENFKPAAELATEAADQARAYEPAWIGTMIEITRGYALGRLGSFEEGAALLEQSLSIGHSSDSPMAAAWAGVYLSELMTGRGDIEPARSHARAALKTARQNESAPSALVQGVNFGHLAPGDYSVEYKNRNNSLVPLAAFRVGE